ncbi:ATP-binding cassette, subfamily C [Paenibacillus algorifonticola]|uniref:ATP-binding cassette, subfamily C n=1 Tax=Paenibacillus algorifonticola TaxID=684063 RepID=A0A1I2GHI1_9BACL|nr:ABC transporter ATP-binding protein [Paenibacillus algorifonticola]SFF16509.1 ATP-binding cassette, subfamily C [Paenibacillus algorifonticola]
MKPILLYMKKLHQFAGKKLYLNMLGIMIVSSLEGVGLLVLIPLLGIIGLFDVQSASLPVVPQVSDWLGELPQELLLAAVLAIFIGINVGQGLLQRQQTNQGFALLQSFVTKLRMDIYQALLQSNWAFFLGKRKSDFNHILSSELSRVNQGMQLSLRLVTTGIFTLVQIGLAFYLSYQLTLLILVCGGLLSLFSRKYTRGARSLGTRLTELSQSYVAGITDHFNGIKEIKSNRLEESHLSWFSKLTQQMEHNNVQFVKLQSNSQLIFKSISALMIAGCVFLSVQVLQVGVAQLTLIVLIFTRLWPKLTLIQTSMEQIVLTLPAFKSLNDLMKECGVAEEMQLNKPAERTEQAEPAQLKLVHELVCQDVYYRYREQDETYALKHINLRIPANSMTAIVGKSGAGKSTLIDTLIGLIVPQHGAVLLDGAPLDDSNRFAYRSAVSYVSQDPFLFNASIRENLKLVLPGATEEQLWEALAFSASDAFVRALPQGLDTIVGDRGVRLSGGERQRIVLARAMLRQPSILVLDEATSSLDSENELKIQQALEQLKGKLTIIVIAHRLSTIRGADQVIVLEEGRIIQQGGYNQLYRESKGTFSKLLEYQAGGPMG